jgi:aryl-alcohol dehydrogenase-like predicted oxidoreductase
LLSLWAWWDYQPPSLSTTIFTGDYQEDLNMNYRRLGKAGLKLSELSLGAWVTVGAQIGEDTTRDCMVAAYEAGVNFFDNAEGYASGQAEIVVGNALKQLGWRRESIVVSTKIFWGGEGPNDVGLSHKHIIEGVNNALRRFQLDYVDLVFCHRPDPHTPIEETVRAMDIVIKQGKAFYWGTSEWSAAENSRSTTCLRAIGSSRNTRHSIRNWAMARPSLAR